jgi:putative spermidine/putrescine transport system ATP-binding protein
VLYLGANTRYLVALEGGGELTVLAQNRDTHFEPAQGEAVRLWWDPRHLMRFEG